MKIVLASDKSKGHLYPALVFARHCTSRYPRSSVVFYGVRKEERSKLEGEGFLCVGHDLGFRNLFLEGVLRFIEALAILLLIRPKKVFGFGGRNSFFIVLLSSVFTSTYLYEPNIDFGKANKILSFFVKRSFLGLRRPSGGKR